MEKSFMKILQQFSFCVLWKKITACRLGITGGWVNNERIFGSGYTVLLKDYWRLFDCTLPSNSSSFNPTALTNSLIKLAWLHSAWTLSFSLKPFTCRIVIPAYGDTAVIAAVWESSGPRMHLLVCATEIPSRNKYRCHGLLTTWWVTSLLGKY